MDDQMQHAPTIEPGWTLIRVALLILGVGGLAIGIFLLFAYGWSPALLMFLIVFAPPFLVATSGLPVRWFTSGTRIYPDLMPRGVGQAGILQFLSSAWNGDALSFDWIFNASLIVVMLVIGFCIPAEIIDKIQLAIVLFVVSLMTIYLLQPKAAFPTSLSDFLWLLFVGSVSTVWSLRLEPIWVTATSLILRGHLAGAGRLLNSRPHANLFLFVGLMMVFASLIGMIKLGIISLIRKRRGTQSLSS